MRDKGRTWRGMLGLDLQNRIGLNFDGNCRIHLEQGRQEKTSGQDVKAKVPNSGFGRTQHRVYSRIMGSV
jgi:hypothetical protein